MEIPQDPFDRSPDPNDPIPDDQSDYDWRYDDDNNMTDEEWDEFQIELNNWLDSKRIENLTTELIDTTDLVIDFLLMDEKHRSDISNMSDKEQQKISNILHKKRLQGKTSGMWKQVGIKYLGDRKMWDKMLDWEKEYYEKHH